MQDEDPFARLGAEVKRRRLAAGLSQERLAVRTGFDQAQVSRAESCRRFPPASLVKAIDDALAAGGSLVELYAVAFRDRQARGAPYRGQEDDTNRRQFLGGLAGAALVAADVSRQLAAADPDPLTVDEIEAELDAIELTAAARRESTS